MISREEQGESRRLSVATLAKCERVEIAEVKELSLGKIYCHFLTKWRCVIDMTNRHSR